MLRRASMLFVLLAFAAAPIPGVAARGDALDPGVAPFVSVNAKTVAIVHVRVIDGTGSPAQDDRTVIFTNGVITALGAFSQTPVPAGATTINGTLKTLMTGYVGTHNHLFTGVGSRGHHYWRSMPFSFPRLYLAAGTTTIRTTGSFDVFAELHLRQRIDAGTSPGPNIDVTSPYLTGPGNQDLEMWEIRDASDGRQTVDFWADRGVTSFKVYTYITRDALGGVIDEAHKRGLKVMGHLCSVGYREAAAFGIDELEHGPYFTDTEFVPTKTPDACPDDGVQDAVNAAIDPDDPRIAALIADLIRHHVAVSSTLPVFERLPPLAVVAPSLDLMDDEQRAYVESTRARISDPATYTEMLKKNPNLLRNYLAVYQHEMAFEVQFLRAGGLLTCGPDPSGYGSVIAGLGDWREIELLVEAGLQPLEAIHVATENGAVALGRSATVGTVAVGKNADLTLVNGDPLQKIADIENVETVFKSGVGYDSKKLFDSVKGLVGHI